MNMPNKTRREFIKSCFRFGVGGGLVFTGIALVLRKKPGQGSDGLCQITSPCQGCSKFSGCSLPRAQNVKQNTRVEGGSRVRE